MENLRHPLGDQLESHVTNTTQFSGITDSQLGGFYKNMTMAHEMTPPRKINGRLNILYDYFIFVSVDEDTC